MTSPDNGKLTFALRCEKCGSNEITIPDVATDEIPVFCPVCETEIARWGDVKTCVYKATEKKAADSAADIFANALKGLKNTTFKKGR